MKVNLGTAGKRSDVWLWESGCCKGFKADSATRTLASPTVNPVTDKDTVISGKVSSAIAGGTVVVSNGTSYHWKRRC